jgi:hypothetical protein
MDIHSLRATLRNNGLLSPPSYKERFEYSRRYIDPHNLRTISNSVDFSSRFIKPKLKPNFVLYDELVHNSHADKVKDYFERIKNFDIDDVINAKVPETDNKR